MTSDPFGLMDAITAAADRETKRKEKKMKRTTIADACREAWKDGRVEKIAHVADMMRHQHGFNYAQVHACFCESLGKEITLAKFDEIMRLADDGYTGTLAELGRRTF